MQAQFIEGPGSPLHLRDVERPEPKRDEVLIKVLACGVCRTDLHILDGELPNPVYPLIPGHEIVGEVIATGSDVTTPTKGDRVGVPWLGWTCGHCRYCRTDRENLCEHAEFTGYTRNGGYADYLVADARYAFALPGGQDPVETAPLLCAGLIGYRAWRFAGDAQRVGLYGFGAAAHILAQLLVADGRDVYAFTRPGDSETQAFARHLGVTWAGNSDKKPPCPLDAALIFAPVGSLVPQALMATGPGGQVVCAGIHMSDIPAFAYELLWKERTVCSVANLTRADGEEFFNAINETPVHTHTRRYPLAAAPQALEDLRAGRFTGAAVLVP